MKNLFYSLVLTLAFQGGANAEDVETILSIQKQCSPTFSIRAQQLTEQELEQACKLIAKEEKRFHQLFGTQGKPVKNDYNVSLRANIYNSREDYVKYVSKHFDVPSDNGGMYLEGKPGQKGNQAEFVAYEKHPGQVWNLAHEYVHYLDGRFNSYGDFCDALHDDHSAPEYCPKPSPKLPHTVWWGEGVAEYVAKLEDNSYALERAQKELGKYQLSDLFNTSYHQNGGGSRVYAWGYLAVRFMMENHRDEIEKMLSMLRVGNDQGYYDLVADWGTQFDQEFSNWVTVLTSEIPTAQQASD